MRSELFVGLDIGTGGGRCLIVDDRGSVAAAAARSWRYATDPWGFAELDPEVVYRALADVTREAMSRVDAAAVCGAGVTSQRTGVVILDGGGTVLHAGPNADGRGFAGGIDLERAHGDLVYRTAGRLPVMLYLPARLAWLRANRPDIAERARLALSWSDWLVWRLTGEACTEPTQAAEMLCYDVAAGRWSTTLCEALGVPRGLLPPVLPRGTAAGRLRSDDGDAFGVIPGIPVVSAGADTACGVLAAGALEPGTAAVIAGTTMLAVQAHSEAVSDPLGRLWTSPSSLGSFVLEAHCGEAGAALDWAAGLMGESVEWIDAAAADAAPGCGGLVFVDPFPSPARDFALVRNGALAFPAPLLALGRPREDAARAVLEGIAFAAAAGLDWCADLGGPRRALAVAGGLARSRTFCRILATATGEPVTVTGSVSDSAHGAAIIAAAAVHAERQGARAGGDPAAETAGMRARQRVVEPEPAWANATAAALGAWRERARDAYETSVRVGRLIGA